MPDVHVVIGFTVGTVIPTTEAKIPSFGRRTGHRISKTFDLKLRCTHVPHHGGRPDSDAGGWKQKVPQCVAAVWKQELDKGYPVLCKHQRDMEQKNHFIHLGHVGRE